MFTTSLAFIGLFLGLSGLLLGGQAFLRARLLQSEYQALARRALAVNGAGADPQAVRDVAVLHYDALEEMRGARSFSLALLNSHGDGVVITSINGRTEARTYAKVVTRGESETLSPEERRVIRTARLGDGIGACDLETDAEPEKEQSETDPLERWETKEENLVSVVSGAQARRDPGDTEHADTEAGPPEPRTEQ